VAVLTDGSLLLLVVVVVQGIRFLLLAVWLGITLLRHRHRL
jgi:hypothetical protein